MIRDPELRAAVEAARRAWERRQEQLALDLDRNNERQGKDG